MCKIFEEVEQRGVKIGKEQGKREGILLGKQQSTILSIQNLMKNLNLNIEEAMNVLSIPKEEQEHYTHLIH